MPKLSYIFLIFMLVGCAKSITKDDLPKLNGYWEIEKVVFRDGNTKDYSANPIIDYLRVEDDMGFRKKVQPKFDGTYDTSNDAEPFAIVKIKERFYMLYENDMNKWQEEILAINDDDFSVVNADGVQYHYKRFEPISAEKK